MSVNLDFVLLHDGQKTFLSLIDKVFVLCLQLLQLFHDLFGALNFRDSLNFYNLFLKFFKLAVNVLYLINDDNCFLLFDLLFFNLLFLLLLLLFASFLILSRLLSGITSFTKR